MMSDPIIDIAAIWRRLLIDVELAKNYHLSYSLSTMGATPRNPILEYLLPTLLYVKMVSILDEALITYIDSQGLTLPKKDRNLNGRINFLTTKRVLGNSKALHNIRDRRNGLAHEASQQTNWNELEDDLNEIARTLQHLAFVGKRPSYKFFAEQSGMSNSSEPDVWATQDFHYGLKEGDKLVAKISWTQKLYNDEQEKKG
jgi:hypothetical protein